MEGCNMYLDDYKRWLAADLEDPDLKPELLKIADDDVTKQSKSALQCLLLSEQQVSAEHSVPEPTE